VLKSDKRVHHEHRAEWPLLAFVDLTVARSLNLPEIGQSGMGVENNAYSFGYSHFGVAARGPLPVEKNVLSLFGLIDQKSHHFVDPSR
jgi:hypothetical protein